MAREKLVFDIEAVNKKFRDAVDDSVKRTQNLEQNLQSITRTAGVAFAGLSASVGFFVNEAAKIETINTQFEVLTGSVLGAEKAVSQLQEISASTPFAFEEVAAAGKQLLGFGFSVDSLTENINNLGDVAAASGAPITDLSLIFGQVAAAGKLTGERLLQLQERAIPIGPALAQTLGVAESSIRELVSKGAVDFETFQKAFRSLSAEGGFAFGGLEKQSQTLQGQLSTLGDNFSLVAAGIGRELLPVAKELTTALIGVFQELRNNPEFLETAANVAKVALVTTGLVTALGSLGLIFIKIKVILVGITAAVGAFGTVLASIPLAIGAIVAIVTGGLIGAFLTYDSKLSFTQNLTENFAKRIAALFSGLGSVIKGAFTLNTQDIKDGLNEIKLAFSEAGTDIVAGREKLEADRLARQQKEIEDEKLKQEALIEEEKAANARKLENQKLLEQQKREAKLESEALDRELDAELNDIKLQLGREFNEKEEEALRESLTKKREEKNQNFAKDILELQKQRQKEAEEEKKFGKTFVALKKATETDQFKNAQNFSNATIQLQRSSNSTLKGIGKAAALTRIGIETAQGAISAYSSLAGIPVIGPALGAAAAAAVVAFGAEQTSGVLAAQTGGRVPGFGSGDRIPAMLEPGELVVPKQSFEDVIEAETSRRLGESGSGQGGGIMEVLIGFTDNAFEIIEEKLIERRRIDRIGLGSLG